MHHPLVPRRGLIVATFLLVGALACSAVDQPKVKDTTSTVNNQKTPSAPSGVSAVAGDAQATVSWQAPQSAGSSAITQYTVIASPGNDTVRVAAPTTQAVVTGLANGTAYTFVVHASNSVGMGPASPASSAVTPQAVAQQSAPSAPLGVTAIAGDGQATVSWQVPQSPGSSAIASYTVFASPGNDSATVAAPTTTAVVSGLTNGTAYTFVVRAKNGVGVGAASAASNAVTPKTPVSPPPAGRWVSGYYVAYQRNLYSETTIDFTNMTHVIVGAIEATATGGVTTDFLIGATAGPALAKTVSSRAHAANRKAILMLGGSGFRDNILASATNYRATFVSNLLAAMDSLGYDGIDIDWEPVTSTDQPILLQLFKDLRTARPNIILTFPVDWSWYAPSSWYVDVAGVVDQINLMSYGMADAWSGWSSWHGSALVSGTSSEPSSITRSINAYLAAGVPAAKLGVGIGAYGSCWRGPTGPGQATGSGVVAGDGTMSYANIMSSYYSATAFRWDSTAKVPYLSSASGLGAQGCNFVSYEDPQSIAAKGAYVKSQGLGGAMMWTINEGHVSTAATGQQDPLLAAAYNSIVP